MSIFILIMCNLFINSNVQKPHFYLLIKIQRLHHSSVILVCGLHKKTHLVSSKNWSNIDQQLQSAGLHISGTAAVCDSEEGKEAV